MTDPGYIIGWHSLRGICPTLSRQSAEALALDLGTAMALHQITTPERAAMFIAQVAHESGQFQFRTEVWGPTPAQSRYWCRFIDLGNWLPSHGYMYRGRGYLQITGRRNYVQVSKALGHDFLGAHAQDLASPRFAALSAAWWWQEHRCNQIADTKDFVAVTRRINGGVNGLSERQAYYHRALPIARYLVPRRPR